MRRHREKTAVYEPRREASEETSLADPLISNCSLQNWEEIDCCCLRHPACGTLLRQLQQMNIPLLLNCPPWHFEQFLFIHMAVLGLRRCLGFSLVAASRGLLFSCGAWASRRLRLLLLWSLSSGCVGLHSCRHWARYLRLPGSRAQVQ